MKSYLAYILYILSIIGLMSGMIQFVIIWNLSTDPYLYAALPEFYMIFVSCLGILIFTIGWLIVYPMWRKMR
jgi:hypothetical protein